MIERLFQLQKRGSTATTEVTAGLTAFMTMAYIIFVNPQILGNCPGLKEHIPALVVATCLAAAVPTILIGLWTNAPLAFAPGMGLNAAVAFGMCLTMGYSWEQAMGVVVLEGIIITILVLTGMREAVMNMIPMPLKQAIVVGIGLFITVLGLVAAGIIHMGTPSAPLTYGSFSDKGVLVATAGLLLTMVMFVMRWRAALLLGIAFTTLLAWLTGMVEVPETLVLAPRFDTMFRADVIGALHPAVWAVVLAFMISDFFDTMGTTIGVLQQADLMDKEGGTPKWREILFIDSLAAIWGGLCGASSSTMYIEAASGVAEGGRTGLMSVTIGLLFLAAVFFSPIVGMVPAQATAPALVMVGFLMMSQVREISFDNLTEGIPAFLTLVGIPLTYSIAHGIGFGLISFLVLMIARKRWREIHPLLAVVSALFIISFATQ